VLLGDEAKHAIAAEAAAILEMEGVAAYALEGLHIRSFAHRRGPIYHRCLGRPV